VLRRSLRNASKLDHGLLYNDACRKSLPVRCPLWGWRRLHDYKAQPPFFLFRCRHSQRLAHAVVVKFTLASLSLPKTCSHWLLRCLGISLGAPVAFSQTPHCDFGPPSILLRSTPLQWPLVLIHLPFRPHFPRGCPFVRLVIKSASAPPCSRRPGPINYAGSTASSSNKRRQRGKGLSDGPDHCPILADICDNLVGELDQLGLPCDTANGRITTLAVLPFGDSDELVRWNRQKSMTITLSSIW
jgi:hypothetical protein